MWENTVYLKNIVFTMFFKHLAISTHRYFSEKILICPCFFTPLFHSAVFEARSLICLSKMWFWTPICAPRGLPNATIGVHFSAKRAPKWSTPNEWDPPEADLGATSDPKRTRLRLHRFKDRFWRGLGLDFRAIWVRFRNNLSYHIRLIRLFQLIQLIQLI